MFVRQIIQNGRKSLVFSSYYRYILYLSSYIVEILSPHTVNVFSWVIYIFRRLKYVDGRQIIQNGRFFSRVFIIVYILGGKC